MAYAGKAGGTRRIRPIPNSAPRTPLTRGTSTAKPIGVIAAGVAVGLLFGAGVALLFAPQRGRETREDLRQRLRRARRRGRNAWDDLGDELRRFRRDLRRARRRRQLENEAPAEP
jgi:hypothetical protein